MVAKSLTIPSYRRKLSPYEKFASRIGYMGSGFLIAAQWTLEPSFIYYRFYICDGSNII
jgi:hypothetical protein